MDGNTAYGKNIIVIKKSSRSRKLSVYSNLSHARKTKKDAVARSRAQYLATLPKNPVKRLLYRLHPRRFWAYWLSKRGAFMALKVVGVAFLLLALLIGGLFAYFRKDIDSIQPDQLAKSVQTTVTTYLDRNGKVLWEDRGDGDYKLVVPSQNLSNYLKQATVSIEDKDFYKEGGVSPSGLIRAAINNVTGGSTQGASTLTQQLVKQVFFANQAQDRGLSGIARKIKEAILAIEVDRTYTKDQVLSLYLNESPYGGRRNGAESGAQTYFGVSAKDITLPEAALLAAIPQDPTAFNPYNVAGNAALVVRQHTVLDNMASQGYITQAQADAAKKVPILDMLRPESDQYTNIKAGNFVQMVRSELINQLGATAVGQGGLTVTTTLDLDIQNKLEEAMGTMFSSSLPIAYGFDNGAATVEDSQTGQIVAMMGSRSFSYPGYGQVNAATAYLQPGSTIKPLVYTQLFQQKPAGQQNYGSGSILPDEPINGIYCNNTCTLNDSDLKFNGNITIRDALAQSRNIPAVEAMYISGVKPTIDLIHKMGGTSYCTVGQDTEAGLASAIGGCGIRQVDLVNAYASIARNGVYKPQSDVLKVTNTSGDVLKQWSDTSGAQVASPQSTYVVDTILNDDNARRPLDGYHAVGMYIPGVPTGTKTGTSDNNGNAKDIWMMSYSPALTMSVWLGNSDGSILKRGTSATSGPIIASVMTYAHQTVYANEGKWKPNQWFTQPTGIQKVGSEFYPSWWNKADGQTNAQVDFDKVSKYKATKYTPASARISLAVTQSTDPITKKPLYTNVPVGYDATQDDNVHLVDDVAPSITGGTKIWLPSGAGSWTTSFTVAKGSNAYPTIGGVAVTVSTSTIVATSSNGTTWTATYTGTSIPTTGSTSAIATDNDLYASAAFSF
jgi:membrane peptidoglycan carboxypeptidase